MAYYCVYVVYVYTCLLPRYTVSFFVACFVIVITYTVAFSRFCTCQSVMCVCVHFVACGCGGASLLRGGFCDFWVLFSFVFKKNLNWMRLFLELLWLWISYPMWFYIFYQGEREV